MKLIYYAGAELLTGDEIAVGVLRYCEALAGSVVAEIIEIPVRDEDGSVSLATLLVGPSSEMVAKDVKSEQEEIVDPALMSRLEGRIRAQHVVADSIHHPAESSDVWQPDY